MFDKHDISVIAHRGAAGYAPENTMPAFECAVEQGAEAFELDLQLTADDEVVVFHDGTVDRITGAKGRVRDYTLSELQSLDAGYHFTNHEGKKSYRGEGVSIPTLADLLDAFPDMPMVVEMKTDSGRALVDATAQVIERHRAEDQVVIGSFSYRFLRRFRSLMPHVKTGFSEKEVRNFYLLQACKMHHFYTPPADMLLIPPRSGPFTLAKKSLIDAAHQANVPVHMWTINDENDMRTLLELRVDGIMTEFPDQLCAIRQEVCG